MNISLSIQASQSTKPSNYRNDITITGSSSDITPYLFIKQRMILPDGTTDDTFLEVASPAQIADLPQQAPVAPGTFFRDSTISLISDRIDLLSQVQTQVLNDLLLTLQQSKDLQTLTTTYHTIDAVTGIN